MAGRRDSEMKEFWASLPPKLKSSLYHDHRRLVLSSDEIPLSVIHYTTLRLPYKTAPKFYLFNDAFVVVQGTTPTEYLLDIVWLEHVVPSEGVSHSQQNMSSFQLVFPESTIELQCKELVHKSKWVSAIADTLGMAFNITQFVSGRGDLNLDTKLELLRSRDYLEYTFRSLPEHRDGTYKGAWKNAKPHGQGEFKQETTGRLFTGSFKDGKFHGEGEMHWFADRDARKKYIGEFRNGKLDGQGEMKYSNGDVYSGHWTANQRSGYGRLEQTSRKASFYLGSWENDKRNGYGIYEDKMKHERYLGMWVDGVRSGPGIIVNSSGTYCEAIFASGTIASGNDGFVIDPNGRSFMGRIGPDLKLTGKGLLTLTNGTSIEGTFGGNWFGKIEVTKGTLADRDQLGEDDTDGAAHAAAMAELQIAKLDKRIGNCTVMAFLKWQPIFAECESSLGFSGDAANDVFSAWSRLAAEAFQRRSSYADRVAMPSEKPRRSNSLTRLQGRKTVKVPVQLIPLERARALTAGQILKDEMKKEPGRTRNYNGSTVETMSLDEKPDISRPINIEESTLCCSYPSAMSYRISLNPYAPQADFSSTSPDNSWLNEQGQSQSDIERQGLSKQESTSYGEDLGGTIQSYVDKAFNTSNHPLGVLMNRLESVYQASYEGIGANKFLLPHAIAETHSIIKRIHSIVRILFPYLSGGDENISQYGHSKAEGYSDPDDYVSIESGYTLLHSLVFTRLFPTLITLYVLHHEENDQQYQRGLDLLKRMDNERLVQFIRFPEKVCKKIVGKEADGEILKALDQASNTLRVINSLFTPGEFLEHFKNAFTLLSSVEQLSGDFLLPAVVFILSKADVPHLGAYLHFLMDFASTQPEDEYTLVTYEAAYNFLKTTAPGKM